MTASSIRRVASTVPTNTCVFIADAVEGDGRVAKRAGTVGRYEAHRLDDDRIGLTPADPAPPDPCEERREGIALGPYRSYPLNPAFTDE